MLDQINDFRQQLSHRTVLATINNDRFTSTQAGRNAQRAAIRRGLGERIRSTEAV